MPDALAFELTGAGLDSEVVDQARAQARAVGYAQGWSQGLHEALAAQADTAARAELEQQRQLEEYADRLSSVLVAVNAAAASLSATSIELTEQLSDRMLAAAVELAIALVGQELSEPARSAVSALRRVLRLAPADEAITIWLGSQDYDTLTGPDGAQLIAAIDAAAAQRIQFECDPALNPGDALGRSAATTIDARLAAAIARVREYVG